jgi:hypothetical protein
LEIENKALGYKIKYLLMAFSDNANTLQMYYEGRAFFEDMPGKPRQLKRWKNNRQLTYFGSDMHFYRSIIAQKVIENGFTVRRIINKPNPAYKGGPDNKYIRTLITTPLNITDYYRLTEEKGIYAIEFKDMMQVIYKNNGFSASAFTINAKYAFFDNNGILLNPQAVVMTGNWGEKRMADTLPIDYDPDAK